MPILLHLDTAVAGASVALSEGSALLGEKRFDGPRDSAAWIQVAIRDLVQEAGRSLSDLDAVSVTAGPGSYTGLRVGLATAKGLCYALGRPLIALPTLEVMAAAAGAVEGLLCPMIDARRMEVFTAVYDHAGNEVRPVQALVLDEHCFSDLLEAGPVTFFGNGAPKWQGLVPHPNAHFQVVDYAARHAVALAERAFSAGRFMDLAYGEPLYGKEFYTPQRPPVVRI
ncbi:tRNA (adenosine(37)-N6)-threonylcarbamoyltransferase complex dimerization subunit type 1 TsaB [Flaviaesturariibacter amylovorans]|uniref:tRNA (Adenosine(37)-N6)-threonylcarbamoyltransferase complex dimerization subunit type 1 TsaB n=1 Tax=Flaviaesturariibacter amylovorans TaxID=1084520 RepID=A0ABP8GBB0_9BACT